MRPLTLDDLLPLDEYASRRREFFEAHGRYVDRYRRVRVGPLLTLLFENRQTLWFRVHELLRVARLSEPSIVQQELDLCNRLLPGRQQLQAALIIDVHENAGLTEQLRIWRDLRGESLAFRIGDECLPANLVTTRPEDRTIGAAHWVQFAISDDAKLLLRNFLLPACFAIGYGSYRHDAPPLNEHVRQSLLEDLEM